MSMNRTPGYLRVSLLSGCNLQCSYCRPPGQKRHDISAPDDKVRSAIRFLHGCGIRKIRFTGGEPTLAKGLCALVAFIKDIDRDIHAAVTSNGVLLASQARALSDAGLDSVNVSIDTLDAEKFHSLTGRHYLNRVIAGIDAAAEHIGKVKLNCVLIRGVNDDEAEKLIAFADDRGLDMRFIEFMPNRYSSPGDPRYISAEEVRGRLGWEIAELPGNPTSAARYYTNSALRIRVGFISSVSHPFCGGCDRIRLTADGMLHTCLYDSRGINLFDLLENDANRARAAFEKLMASKQFGGCRIGVNANAALPSFSAIGG